jgi:hypothetical protein
MAASLTFYNSFSEYVADGTINLDTHTFKVMLVSSGYTFSAAHTQKSDITNELSTANGYTAGGATLGSVTWGQTGGTATFDAADTTWNASGGAITARRAIVYSDTASNDELVCSILLDTTPADVSAPDGNPLTLAWNASGIFTLAPA